MFRRLVLAVAVFAGLALTAGAAAASCAAPTGPMRAGTYHNVDRNSRSIVRFDLIFVCGDTIHRNSDGTTSVGIGGDPYFEVRLWGSCSPTPCDWGRARLRRVGVTPIYLASYNQGFARRAVSLGPSGNGMALQVQSTYTDGRPPRTSSGTFRR